MPGWLLQDARMELVLNSWVLYPASPSSQPSLGSTLCFLGQAWGSIALALLLLPHGMTLHSSAPPPEDPPLHPGIASGLLFLPLQQGCRHPPGSQLALRIWLSIRKISVCLSIGMFLSVSVSVRGHVRTYAHSCVHICTYPCLCRPEVNLSYVIPWASCFMKGRVSHWLEAYQVVCWLAVSPRDVPLSTSQALGLKSMGHHTWLIFYISSDTL